jgi:hypothetical protein
VYLQNVPIKVHTICIRTLIVGIPPPHWEIVHCGDEISFPKWELGTRKKKDVSDKVIR